MRLRKDSSKEIQALEDEFVHTHPESCPRYDLRKIKDAEKEIDPLKEKPDYEPSYNK